MKKIININISGRAIPIEDSAYDQLKEYLESLRHYFRNEEGRDEIINDMESRISELMSDAIKKGAHCIAEIDIQAIIANMGKPEELDQEIGEETTASSGTNQQNQPVGAASVSSKRGRLYRSEDDKFIAGVCGGIASYLNIDPAIMRILFAIITIGSFGFGVLLYAFFWIALPVQKLEPYRGKRFYRNNEDRVLGGVAGGLAAYFQKESWTIRLIFAAPILLGIIFGMLKSGFFGVHIFPGLVFGSISSIFIVTYIILWIVLPEAKSEFEKMEMRGEKVDINSIFQNVKGSMKEFGSELKNTAEQFGNNVKNAATETSKNFSTEISGASNNIGKSIGHIISVLVKVIIIMIVGSIALGLFGGLMALLFGGIAWWPFTNFLFTSTYQEALCWLTLILFILVPLVGIIVWLIRRLINAKGNRYIGWTFGGLWTLGWVAATLLAVSITADFKQYQTIEEKIQMQQPNGNQLVLDVAEPQLYYNGRYNWMGDGDEGWDLSNDTFKLADVQFIIEKSPDTLYHAYLLKNSFGKNTRNATEKAGNLQYTITAQNGVLQLGNGFAVSKNDKYRGQNVAILIKVPEGKKIWLNRSVNDKLDQDFIKLNWKKYGAVRENNHYRYLKSEVNYTMLSDGRLDAYTDIPEMKMQGADRNNYRYDHNDSNVRKAREAELLKEKQEKIKEELEEQKRQIKETEDKLKQLEQKNNTTTVSDKIKKNKMNSEKDIVFMHSAFMEKILL